MDEFLDAETKLSEAERLVGEARRTLLRLRALPRHKMVDLERVEKILSDYRWALSRSMSSVA